MQHTIYYMQHTNFKSRIAKVFALAMFCLTILSVNAKAGIDSYEIYLNNKLLMKQSLAEPMSLKSLQLDKANAKDQLVIYYSQCNAANKIGKGRSIALKDAKGNILREWKFTDAAAGDKSMTIPVKELLELEKKNTNSSLSLYYNAQGLEKEQRLTALNL